MVETPSLISYLRHSLNNNEPIDHTLLATFIMAYPTLISNFFALKNDVYFKSKERFLNFLIPPEQPLESPFSTPNLADIVYESFCLDDDLGNTSPEISHVEVTGMSFLKPKREYSADLISRIGNVLVVCDGATMVANPQQPGFPQQIERLCTTDQHEFLPDVFWSTAISIFLNKTDFKSPFIPILYPSAKQVSKKFNFDHFISNPYLEPKDLINTLNQMIYELYCSVTNIPLNENTKVYFPSGVMGCVNLLTQEWASTGDVRIGRTVNSKGGISIVNDYEKVDQFDVAAKNLPINSKVTIAKHRAVEVGNMQGLPINVSSGTMLPDANQGNCPTTIAIWTDGEDLREETPGDIRFKRKFEHNQETLVSLTGSLLAIHPLLYHLYLLRRQNQYSPNTNPSSISTIPWRADDACFIVARYKPGNTNL